MPLLVIAYGAAFGIGLLLGVFHLLIWRRLPERREFLFAALMGLSAGVLGVCEFYYLRASKPGAYQVALEIQNLAVGTMLVSMVWLVRSRLGSGRAWLAWGITISWGICMAATILGPGNVTFLEVTSVNSFSTSWGETYHIPTGMAHVLRPLADLTTLAIVGYVIDAAILAFRGGDRQEALWVSGPILFFILAAGIHTPLVDAGIVHTPYVISLVFIAIAISMTISLVNDIAHSASLTRRLDVEKQRWDTLLRGVQLAVAQVGVDGKITYANPYLETIGGWPAGRLVGAETAMLFHPDERSEVRELLANAGWSTRANKQRKLLTASGAERDVLWFSVALHDEAGKPDGFISFGQDVTDQLAMQAERDRIRRELEKLSRALTMGEMASSFAHELSQPIAAVLSNAQALEIVLGRRDEAGAEEREILRDIISDTRRARDLMNGIRQFVFNAEPVRSQFELGTAILETVDMLRHEALLQSVTIATEPPPVEIDVVAARIEIQQVLMNIALNAVQAAGDVENGKVVISWSRPDDEFVEILVDDNGPGLAPDIAQRILEPFVTSKETGSGIGLAVSRRVVQRHGGQVSADGSPLGGMRFRILLAIALSEEGNRSENVSSIPAGAAHGHQTAD